MGRERQICHGSNPRRLPTSDGTPWPTRAAIFMRLALRSSRQSPAPDENSFVSSLLTGGVSWLSSKTSLATQSHGGMCG